MVVISDTSPVSGLYRINHLFLLERLFGRVILPDAVFQEILQLRSFGYDLKEILTADWIEVKSATNVSEVGNLLHHLDLGEAEAIVLAKELHADLLVMDESKGRAMAQQEGITIIGLAGILVEAKAAGHITSVKLLLDRLLDEVNFRMSRQLYEFVLRQVGEMP
ncbi:MAG: DUF3368 domain-containing protein [Saprospirales bacterium]|nr:DUF3368 domain-containing protein [Saprospirales bacterium]